MNKEGIYQYSPYLFYISPLPAVQHERGPRNSTIRKQMALLLKESNDLIHAYHVHRYQPMSHSVVDHHETAARILFNAVNWTKTVPAFQSLSNHDQVYLINLI
jgi:hypothetical protein